MTAPSNPTLAANILPYLASSLPDELTAVAKKLEALRGEILTLEAYEQTLQRLARAGNIPSEAP